MLLLGVGESCDAYHMSSPHPDGMGARLAMEQALAAAGLAPADIDYVNLHGTATKANDASEDKAVYELFGGATPVSSTKGATGHLLGAAGITEAIISLLAIEHGMLPGGLHTRTIDPGLRSNYLLENRDVRVARVLSNSFGFGGSNCSLVLGRAQ
jgi:3-oxoacyl-[acyl-carrier-protein] synthase-1